MTNDNMKDAIVKFIVNNPGCYTSEIEKQLLLGGREVREALNELRDAGRIELRDRAKARWWAA